MQNNRFVVLMGHLNEYPLSDLINILSHQRKSGRLLIEYPGTPASFYFEEGKVFDVQIGTLSGLQAVCVAMAQPDSPFNFNPLIRASQRSIDNSQQRIVSELFGCWDESPLQIDVVPTVPERPTIELPAAQEVAVDTPLVNGREVLALPAFVPQVRQNRTNRAMAAAGLMMLGISSVIAVTGGFQKKVPPVGVGASNTESAPRTIPASLNQPIPSSVASKILTSQNDFRKSKEATSLTRRVRQDDDKTGADSENTAHAGTATVPSEPSHTPSAPDKSGPGGNAANVQWVDVVMRVENGRVLQAAIANHKSGVDGYEALALRIARQRRYPTTANGQETVRIRVGRPE